MKNEDLPESAASNESLPPAKRLWGWLRAQPHIVTWAGLSSILGVIFGPALWGHIKRSADHQYFNDDARQQIFPFFRFSDGELFPADAIGDYYLDCLPMGYRILYTVGDWLWDAEKLSKVLPYLLLAVVVIGVGVAGQKLGGRAAAFVSMALVLGSAAYMGRMVGGLPRGFAFPILAVALAGLATGRLRWVAAMVWAGAAFYPASAVPVGLSLGVLLLVFPSSDRGTAADWGLKKRILFLALTAGIAAAIVLPTAFMSSGHGKVITTQDWDDFPEAGPGGRYAGDDRAPFSPFFKEASRYAKGGIWGQGKPLMPSIHEWRKGGGDKNLGAERTGAIEDLLLLLILLGAFLLAKKEPGFRRLAAFGLALVLAHLVARFIAPYFYLPQRYLAYPLPLLAAVVGPAAVGTVFVNLLPRARRAQLAPVAMGLMVALMLGIFATRGHESAGLTVHIRDDQMGLYEKIAELPKNSLIAGWPQGSVDNIPYLSRRQVLTSSETHQAFHGGYTLEMRRRTRAFFDAYFARDLAPVRALRDQFGVTHLLVDSRHFSGRFPKYFKPFGADLDQIQKATPTAEMVLPRQIKSAGIVKHGPFVLLELSGI